MVKHALTLVLLLPGCGLVAGLRTDYELGDASIDGGEGGTDGSPTDSPTGDASIDAGDAMCPMPTDTNCGGPNCPKCGNGAKCNSGTDCQTGNCQQGHCHQ